MTTAVTLAPLTATQQVRLELRSRPGRYLTMAQLCTLTGLAPSQVQSAIQVLTRQYRIVRRVPLWKGKGDGEQQAYSYNLLGDRTHG